MSEEVKVVIYRDECKGFEKKELWEEFMALFDLEIEEEIEKDIDVFEFIIRRGAGFSMEDILRNITKEFREKNSEVKVNYNVWYIEREPDETVAM